MSFHASKGGGGSPHTPVESPDTLHAVSRAKILIALGEGEIAGGITSKDIMLDGTPLQAADGTMNFSGVSWDIRTGTQQQSAIPGMPAVENEIGVNIELKKAQPWTQRISNTQLDAVRVHVSWPAITQQKSNGDMVGSRVDYRIGVSTNDGAYQWQNFSAEGKTTTAYPRGHRVELPAGSHWDIRVERITADSTSQLLQNRMLVDSYDEIIDARLRYPNTALLYVTFDSKQFGNKIPQISVRMKGRIIRVPRNYEPVTATYTGAWDGTFKWAYSNNPAWVLLDILTNSRFGAGDHITVDDVDKWELYRLSQYCDAMVPDGKGGMERRHTCDVYIQSQNTAFNVIRDIASIFNAMVAYQGNQVVIRGDIPDDVAKVVSNANIVGGHFAYQGGSVKDRHSVAHVSFSNPELNYDDDIEPVSVLDLVRRYKVNIIQLTAIGCTRRSEAHRRGKWALLSNSSDRTVHFRVGLDGLNYKVGSIIGVADALTAGHRMGGRVVSANGTTITVDHLPAKMIPGGKVFINLGDGEAEARTVRGILSSNQILVDRTFSTDPQPGSVWTLDATSFTQADNSAGKAIVQQLFRVTSITDNDDNTFNIVALIHQPDKYAAIDTGAKISRPNISDIPSSTIAKPENVSISAHDMIWQGLSVQTLRVDWSRVSGAVEYEAQWKRDSQDWVNVPTTPTLGFEVPGIYAGNYRARVRAVNAIGASSLWQEALPAILSGKQGKPPSLTALTTTPLMWAIQVDWAFDNGSEDTSHTELQYSPNGQDSWQNLSNIPYPATRYTHYGLKAGALMFYRARAVDKLGNQSEWFGPVGGYSSTDADEYLGDLANQFMTEADGKRLLSQLSFDPSGIIANALFEHSNVMTQMAESEKGRADIIRIDKTIADVTKSVADVEQDLIARYNDTSAQLRTKFTAYADATDANALYTMQAGLRYQGRDYQAGISFGLMTSGGQVKSRVGFYADQFVMLSGQNGNQFSPFAVDGGQVFIHEAMIKNATIGMAKITQELGTDSWYASGGAQGWMINKDGRAYFRNVEVSGTVWANSGYFTGEIRANSGWLNNVTINENCTILGTLSANRIVGDVVQAYSCFIRQGKNNGDQRVVYYGNPLFAMEVAITIMTASGRTAAVYMYDNVTNRRLGSPQPGNVYRYTAQPGQQIILASHSENLDDKESVGMAIFCLATPVGRSGWSN